MIQLFDTLTLDAPKRTTDGYLAVRARSARTGIYDYLAGEVGAPADKFKPNDVVKVYRDANEVFDEAAVRSFIGKPITNDHPRDPVTADNWKRHARGTVMGAMRDGDYLAFDLVLMDSAAIRAVDAGKRELSNGYQSMLDWTPGTDPAGNHYDARQTTIRGNHVALVDKGRAGANCAIKDGERFALCDANPAALSAPKEKTNVKTITLDGLPVNLGDEAAVEAAIGKLQSIIANRDTALATAKTTIDTLTGEKTALEVKLTDAEAKLAPAALDKAVADRQAVIAAATAMIPNLDCKGKTEADIRRAVVSARVGDKATAMSDESIATTFDLLSDGIIGQSQPAQRQVFVPDAIRNQQQVMDGRQVVNTVRALRYA